MYFRSLAEKLLLEAYITEGQFIDIGVPADYAAAQKFSAHNTIKKSARIAL